MSALSNGNFRSVIKTFKNHAPTILNYFRRRATNASAEAFLLFFNKCTVISA
ncbi:MAG: transposase [Lepagella sp.]